MKTVLLLTFLLVLGFVHASASPLPFGSFLSRLRRTAGAGATPSASSIDTPTGRPSLADSIRVHYRQLHARTLELKSLHRSMYRSYKAERYPDVSNPRVHDIVLSYLPTTSSIPSATSRVNHSDVELILLHYVNLIIFKDTLSRVEETETGNITETLTTVVEQLQEIIVRLESTMIVVGYEQSITRVPTNNAHFHPNATTAEQNTRTLLVLQEFDRYIPEVLFDYKTLKTRHASSS